MTLRRRVRWAVAVLLVAVMASGVAVLGLYRRTLLRQVDTQVTALAASPRLIVQVGRLDTGRQGLPAGLAEVYVGRLAADGTWTTLLTPFADPATHPKVAVDEVLTTAVGRGTTTAGPVRTSGDASAGGTTGTSPSGASNAAGSPAPTVRVATGRLPNGSLAVVAVPTTRVEAALDRLRLLLAVVGIVVIAVAALLLWWVERLGLAPITRMTAVADAITAGDSAARVDPADLGSEATEAARLGRALNAMADATSASAARLERFVADASHELRTPLTTLRGYAALHRDDAAVPEATRDALRRIESEAGRMGRLVDALLELTTLDERGLTHREPVDVSALLADIVSDLRVLAPGHEVASDIAPGLVVLGDRDRITQAVTGLTSNAARHTPSGSTITVRGMAEPGEPGAAGAGSVVRIEVADDGPGIPAEHLARVFDRFHRVDGSRSSARGGTGLGLALVAAIARAHGGSATVESGPGGGARFAVTLPAVTLPAAPAPAAPAPLADSR